MWEFPSYSGPRFKLYVIPNQSSDWCGNLHRHRDRVLLTGRLPRQRDHWLAMTRRLRPRTPKEGDCQVSTALLYRNDREVGTPPPHHGTIPSGAGQKRLHISCARLGRPPCGQIPNFPLYCAKLISTKHNPAAAAALTDLCSVSMDFPLQKPEGYVTFTNKDSFLRVEKGEREWKAKLRL